MHVSKQWATTQQNLTQLQYEHADRTNQYHNVSVSLQRTNQALQNLLERQRQTEEQCKQMWQMVQGSSHIQCIKDEMSDGIRCGSCQQEWKLHNLHCYYFSTDMKTWHESKDTCASLQSHLLVVNDRNEQVFISSKMNGGNYIKYWIGYSDEGTEGLWYWVDGSRVMWKFWKLGQPDNHRKLEHCATTEESCTLDSWNDDTCSKKYRYICERDAEHRVFDMRGAFA
ncbi:galactose-specific lectin nattectin-like [Ambystoma mexicanum]|uniref:galactose-specific lectin nattectin-like n=1 Tax=Ambystoma mexicanum TaxID=8296 RepID=UPI0037E7A4A8